jgi:ABC-2 type transport system ATP-binding protein
MITINNVTKQYGSFSAVQGISLEVKPGEIFAFLGINGAGKTTTIRMITGILQPTSGDITIGGFSMAREPLKAKQITGYIPDRPYLYGKLSAREFLYFVADLYEVQPALAEERITSLLQEYGLTTWQNELIENFSHGMKQRVATCAALVHEPRVLVVDEPMVGLDPHGAKLLKERFKAYAARGMSIFLSTHSLNVAEEVADRLAIIHQGKILTTGTLSDIRALTGKRDEGLEAMFLELTAGMTPYGSVL